MANTSIKLKSSGVSGNVPSQLAHGELAINYADGKIYYLDSNNTISFIQTGTGTVANSFITFNANSVPIIPTSPTDTLSLIAGSNISIQANTLNKSITIEAITGSASGFPIVDLGLVTESVPSDDMLDLGTLF